MIPPLKETEIFSLEFAGGRISGDFEFRASCLAVFSSPNQKKLLIPLTALPTKLKRLLKLTRNELIYPPM